MVMIRRSSRTMPPPTRRARRTSRRTTMNGRRKEEVTAPPPERASGKGSRDTSAKAKHSESSASAAAAEQQREEELKLKRKRREALRAELEALGDEDEERTENTGAAADDQIEPSNGAKGRKKRPKDTAKARLDGGASNAPTRRPRAEMKTTTTAVTQQEESIQEGREFERLRRQPERDGGRGGQRGG
jgi:hypothetical protein